MKVRNASGLMIRGEKTISKGSNIYESKFPSQLTELTGQSTFWTIDHIGTGYILYSRSLSSAYPNSLLQTLIWWTFTPSAGTIGKINVNLQWVLPTSITIGLQSLDLIFHRCCWNPLFLPFILLFLRFKYTASPYLFFGHFAASENGYID